MQTLCRPHLSKECVEDFVMVAHIDATEHPLQLVLVLGHGLLERLTLDQQILIFLLPKYQQDVDSVLMYLLNFMLIAMLTY